MITWCFSESGGAQEGTPVFGLTAPDPPVTDVATIYDSAHQAYVVGVDPATGQATPFTVQGHASPVPEPSSMLLILAGIVPLALRRVARSRG